MNVKWLFHPCRHYQADLSLLAADALRSEECVRGKAHLAQCLTCQARFAELNRLVSHLAQEGQRLPELEPSASLRRRWTAAVRTSARPAGELESLASPAWLSGRRIAWSSLAATWALILFFRVGAPDAPKPVTTAGLPSSLREVLLVLRVDPKKEPFHSSAGKQHKEPSTPEALPPRSRGPGAPSTSNFEPT